MEQKEQFKLFISYSGENKKEKDIILSLLNEIKKEESFNIEFCSMEDGSEPCVDDFNAWMFRVIKKCHIMLSIFTKEVINSQITKRMSDELALAYQNKLFRIPVCIGVRDLSDSYEAQLASVSRIYVDNLENLEFLKNKLRDYLKGIYKHLVNGEKDESTVSLPLDSFSEVDNFTFVGRENELKEIDEKFKTGNVVILKGDGGVGKTALAKQYFFVHKEKYTKHYIIDASGGIRNAIVSINFPDTMSIEDEDVRFKLNIENLKKVSNKCIIILDNCDDEIETKSLALISSDDLECRFIVTSRLGIEGDKRIINIAPMNEFDLTKLVYKICEQNHFILEKFNGDSLDEDLKKFFDETDRHTLTVELATSVMCQNGFSVKEITEHLYTNSDEVASSHSNNKKDTIINQIKNLYKMSALSEEELKIAKFLSLVSPQVGFNQRDLIKLLGLTNINSINSLISKTIVQRDSDFNIRMHKLISDVVYISEQVVLSHEFFIKFIHYVVDETGEENESIYFKKYLYTKFILENRQNSLQSKSFECWLLYEASSFCEYAKLYKEEFELKTQLVDNLKKYKCKFIKVYHQFTYIRLAYLCYNYNNLDDAIRYADLAYDLKVSSHEAKTFFKNPGHEYYLLAKVYYFLGNYYRSKKLLDKAKRIRGMQDLLTFYNCELLFVTIVSTNYNMFEETLTIARNAEEYFKKTLSDDINNESFASCYEALGFIYFAAKQYDESLNYFEKVLDIRLKLNEYNTNVIDVEIAYRNLAGVYLIKQDYKNALVYYKKALEILDNSDAKYLKDKETLFILPRLGYIYYMKNDLKALEKMEEDFALESLLDNKSEEYMNSGFAVSILKSMTKYDTTLNSDELLNLLGDIKESDIHYGFGNFYNTIAATGMFLTAIVYSRKNDFEKAITICGCALMLAKMQEKVELFENIKNYYTMFLKHINVDEEEIKTKTEALLAKIEYEKDIESYIAPGYIEKPLKTFYKEEDKPTKYLFGIISGVILLLSFIASVVLTVFLLKKMLPQKLDYFIFVVIGYVLSAVSYGIFLLQNKE